MNIRISHSVAKAHSKGDTMVYRILMFMWSLGPCGPGVLFAPLLAASKPKVELRAGLAPFELPGAYYVSL